MRTSRDFRNLKASAGNGTLVSQRQQVSSHDLAIDQAICWIFGDGNTQPKQDKSKTIKPQGMMA